MLLLLMIMFIQKAVFCNNKNIFTLTFALGFLKTDPCHLFQKGNNYDRFIRNDKKHPLNLKLCKIQEIIF